MPTWVYTYYGHRIDQHTVAPSLVCCVGACLFVCMHALLRGGVRGEGLCARIVATSVADIVPEECRALCRRLLQYADRGRSAQCTGLPPACIAAYYLHRLHGDPQIQVQLGEVLLYVRPDDITSWTGRGLGLCPVHVAISVGSLRTYIANRHIRLCVDGDESATKC